MCAVSRTTHERKRNRWVRVLTLPDIHEAMSNVVLTGFMGTGKSTIGRALARELGYEFIDTDAMIVDRYGTIAQIFEQGGEDAFRQHERNTAVELAGRSGCVISTGGRFMLDDHNAAALVPTSDVFALLAEPEEIARRVLKDGIASRPLLADAPDPVQRIKDLVEQRRAGYARFATVSTDGRSPDDIAAEILARRRRQNAGRTRGFTAVAVAAVAVAAVLVVVFARPRR